MYQCSGSASGSVSHKYGSEDPHPDPYQNVTDPQHCLKKVFIFLLLFLITHIFLKFVIPDCVMGDLLRKLLLLGIVIAQPCGLAPTSVVGRWFRRTWRSTRCRTFGTACRRGSRSTRRSSTTGRRPRALSSKVSNRTGGSGNVKTRNTYMYRRY